MSAVVYYFTGTGNSYAAAQAIAAGLDAPLIPLASVIGQGEIHTEADTIGIVFPVFYADLPGIVAQFASRLVNAGSKYIFAVCTYGGGKGSALKTLRITLKDATLSASYGIRMPQNAFLKPKENKDKLYSDMKRMTELIVSRTKRRKKGFVASGWAVDLIQRPLTPLIHAVVKKYLIETTQGTKSDSHVSLVHRLDVLFAVNESCKGCGLCAKVCPVNNILIENDKPQWQHRCENCLACFNFCPQGAVESQIAQNGYRYLHPQYTLAIAQKQSIGAYHT